MAEYRASRFLSGACVFDACAGVGGDSLALLKRNEVLAVDSNPVTLTCLRLNAGVVCPQRAASLHTLCADVTALDLARIRSSGCDTAFVDPSRRTEGQHGERRRVHSSSDYSPPLEWVQTLRASIPNVGVKISPAIDEATLHDTPDAEVEFVSVRGECREAVLWFGEFAQESRRPLYQYGTFCYTATLLGRQETPLIFAPFECDPASVVSPQAWLYEPDPAVIRAHLVSQLASQLNAGIFAHDIAYLTADSLIETPFATAYRVLESMPYRPKEVLKWLRREGRRVEVVKKRGVPLEPEAVRKSLSGANSDGSPLTLVLTPHLGGTFALLCERVG
ncbi:MAG: class I SAM-dependent methyltransferase [Armatimonadetes bacterium]|nr:class I SAM-dependent methyltransferase [Armatimonadota bacterium]